MADVHENLNGRAPLNVDGVSPEEIEAARLTAYALGQLEGEELAAVEGKLSGDASARRAVSELQSLAVAVRESQPTSEQAAASEGLKQALLHRLGSVPAVAPSPSKKLPEKANKRSRVRTIVEVVAGLATVVLIGALLLPQVKPAREASRMHSAVVIRNADPQDEYGVADPFGRGGVAAATPAEEGGGSSDRLRMMVTPRIMSQEEEEQRLGVESPTVGKPLTPYQMRGGSDGLPAGDFRLKAVEEAERAAAAAAAQNESNVEVGERAVEVVRAEYGRDRSVRAREFGVVPETLDLKQTEKLRTLSSGRGLQSQAQVYPDADTYGYVPGLAGEVPETQIRNSRMSWEEAKSQVERAKREKEIADNRFHFGNEWDSRGRERVGTEQYVPIYENEFLSPREQPLSTFSIDVDTASYANVRRFLNSGRLPPADSVRIEELVNYFRYAYPQPRDGKPFSVNMEVSECPWHRGHWLLRVGLKGREVAREKRPASNLVFLLDVSGSMSAENKLPLLKTAMKMLAGELGEDDKVSIVTYAGEAGLKLGPTRGHEQRKIARVIDALQAGGSTNGSAGIELAYEQAQEGFVEGGTNRVILCTDGDLNVGITSDEALVKLIKQKAKSGVFLTVLGFGEGNLKDGKMERLADNGNGLYAYIDSVREARKVLVEQMAGSTITIAKDVKIQIEFNPAQVESYRLLGYENRVMAAKDFNNDKKDAGEIGAGHTVTALYEIVPARQGRGGERGGEEPLKYQSGGISEGGGFAGEFGGQRAEGDVSAELLTLKLRYKEPEGESSKLLEFPLKDRATSFRSASDDFQFAAAVASFGMVLRGSRHLGDANLAFVEEIAASSLGEDEGGYRAELLDLVRKARGLGVR